MHIGTMLASVGLLHLGVGGVLYGAPLLDMLRAGLFGSAPDFGDRATAFWFIITGFVVLLLGGCVRDVERRGSPLPAPLVPGLILLTLAIVVPMPNSGAWLFAPIAWAANRRARSTIRQRRSTPARPPRT